ncbi:MAG: hypothetical protein EU548_09290 [Promethearchaeota archaeon]|nr:MAG: hypothetical protein EU548_09290 [Candidatus Lokiarchaeota archaeon]
MPTPYLLSIVTVVLILPINFVILSVFAALGAGIGELTAWFVGRGTAEVISKEKYDKQIKGLKELIDKGYGFPLIVLYALTPLPDDLLLIPVGLAKYSLKKSLIACFIGKLLMMLILTGFVLLTRDTAFGQWALSLYGLEVTDTSVKSTGESITSTIMIIGTVIITTLIVKIDWIKVGKRLKKLFKK